MLFPACVSLGDDPLRNQGGGNLVTAGLKLANAQLTTLTPDELQVLVQKVGRVNSAFDFDLTDEQAEDAVGFLVDYELNSVQDIKTLLQQADASPGSVEVPASIQALVDPSAAAS